MPRGSAAYVILTIAIAYLVVGFLFTMLAEPWHVFLDSAFFDFETQWGQDLASWQLSLFSNLTLFALIAYAFHAWISSREATP